MDEKTRQGKLTIKVRLQSGLVRAKGKMIPSGHIVLHGYGRTFCGLGLLSWKPVTFRLAGLYGVTTCRRCRTWLNTGVSQGMIEDSASFGAIARLSADWLARFEGGQDEVQDI